MKVTVCELSDDPAGLKRDWDLLVHQVQAEGSDLILLPEMPFAPWIAGRPGYAEVAWGAFVQEHTRWMARLEELSPAVVLGSRPVDRAGQRLNEGFVWDHIHGYRGVHHKVYLPDEEGFWEASWYRPGTAEFEVIDTGVGQAGFLICTEMWFTGHALGYAQQGVHILACPRATASYSVEKWKSGGVAAAVMSGAFCLSSNRRGVGREGLVWGGTGWVIEPEEGRILGLTGEHQPVLTVEIDLGVSERAKRTYPRYIYV